MKVAFIGIGNMGKPMASNIAKHGLNIAAELSQGLGCRSPHIELTSRRWAEARYLPERADYSKRSKPGEQCASRHDARRADAAGESAALSGPLGMAALAACIFGGAAGAQSLFDSGRVDFSQPQASRGAAAYRESCAACHGPNLDDGQFAGPLKGAAFKAHWHDQPPEALWSLIMKRMPPASPGALSSGTYADIDAYLLQANGERAGGQSSRHQARAHPQKLPPHPSTIRARASALPSLTMRTPDIMPPSRRDSCSSPSSRRFPTRC